MFEHLTYTARKALAIANQEANRLGGNTIGDNDLLLGILKQENSSGAMTLRRLGLEFDVLRRELEQQARPLSEGYDPRKLPQTPDMKRAIESSINVARELGHKRVETAHLLLGMLRNPELGSSRVMASRITLEQAQRAVVELFDRNDALAADGET